MDKDCGVVVVPMGQMHNAATPRAIFAATGSRGKGGERRPLRVRRGLSLGRWGKRPWGEEYDHIHHEAARLTIGRREAWSIKREGRPYTRGLVFAAIRPATAGDRLYGPLLHTDLQSFTCVHLSQPHDHRTLVLADLCCALLWASRARNASS